MAKSTAGECEPTADQVHRELILEIAINLFESASIEHYVAAHNEMMDREESGEGDGSFSVAMQAPAEFAVLAAKTLVRELKAQGVIR